MCAANKLIVSIRFAQPLYIVGKQFKTRSSIPFDCARVLRTAVALDLGVTGKGQTQAVRQPGSQSVSQPSGPSSTLLAAGECATQVAHISGSMMNHVDFPRNPASTTSACECKAKFKVADVASVQLTIELRHHWTGLHCVYEYEQQSKSKSASLCPSPSQSEPALSCT